MNSLHATQLTKSFKQRQVVKGISVEVNNGEIVGLLGPNGAGKTTVFYMIVGLIAADTGDVHFNDTNITELPMHARARLGIGYLPQEASVFRKLTVEQNILAVLELNANLSDDERKQRAKQLMEEFHIDHIADHVGLSLSGGERRRVEIARALATDPKFILLDEPFAGVDPISVSDIKSIIMHLAQKGIGILITDHNVRETLDICERAYIVSNGDIICAGPPDKILADQRVRDVYLGEEFYI